MHVNSDTVRQIDDFSEVDFIRTADCHWVPRDGLELILLQHSGQRQGPH